MSRRVPSYSHELEIANLELGAFTPRLSFSDNYVEELAEDIRANGQREPITVRQHPTKEGIFQVIDGEHRVRAMQKIGMIKIRSEVWELTDQEALILALKANEMHGKRLDKIEEAMHILTLATEPYNWNETKIAEVFNRSQPWVAERLKLARQAGQTLRKSIITRVITPTHAREIASLPAEEQQMIVKTVTESNLSTRETKLLVDGFKIVETLEEKRLLTEKLPKLDVRQATVIISTLREVEPKKRFEILNRPIETYAQVVKEPEQFAIMVQMSPKQSIIGEEICPSCGRKVQVNWLERKIVWRPQTE